MYGSHYSAGQVSNISKQMVQAYHKRSLSDKFFCVYLDATYLPLHRQTFEREAVYMKSRGLKQVELFLSDGVVGMKQALVEAYPKAHFQRCLVHVMRNICAKVRVDDREAVMNDFKQIHQQTNKADAVKILHDFYAKWGKLYSHSVKISLKLNFQQSNHWTYL